MTRMNTNRPGSPAQDRLAAVKSASGLNIIAAIWLILSPFLLGYYELQAAIWNDIIVGVIVLGLGWARVANPFYAPGFSWANAVLGLWLILAPFALNYSAMPTPLWNDVIVGVVIAALATWSAVATPHRSAMG